MKSWPRPTCLEEETQSQPPLQSPLRPLRHRRAQTWLESYIFTVFLSFASISVFRLRRVSLCLLDPTRRSSSPRGATERGLSLKQKQIKSSVVFSIARQRCGAFKTGCRHSEVTQGHTANEQNTQKEGKIEPTLGKYLLASSISRCINQMEPSLQPRGV